MTGPTREEVERLHDSIGGVSTPEHMHGDNLAILLCSFFEQSDGEENENGWTDAAIAGQEAVLKAIRAHYEPGFTALRDRAEAAEARRSAAQSRWLNAVRQLTEARAEIERLTKERDALATASWIAGRVKPLEWKDLGDGKSFRALLPIIGSARVEPYGCCGWWEVLWSMPGQCDRLIPDVFDSPGDAKVAAQADYEHRILSALTTPPTDATAALQAVKDAEWDAAIEAAVTATKQPYEWPKIEKDVHHRIRALRRNPKEGV